MPEPRRGLHLLEALKIGNADRIARPLARTEHQRIALVLQPDRPVGNERRGYQEQHNHDVLRHTLLLTAFRRSRTIGCPSGRGISKGSVKYGVLFCASQSRFHSKFLNWPGNNRTWPLVWNHVSPMPGRLGR